jgi:hypothetical protein
VQNQATIFNPDSNFLHGLVNKLHAQDSAQAAHYTDSVFNEKNFSYQKIKGITATQPAKVVPSVFTGHALKAENLQPKPSGVIDKTAVAVIVLFVVLCIAMVRQYNNRRLAALINAFKASRFALQLQRQEYSINNRAAITLLIAFVITIAILSIHIIDYFIPNTFPGSYLFRISILSGVIVLAYSIKMLSINVMGYIFDNTTAAKEYIFNILLFNQVAGVFLLPVAMVMLFSSQISIEIPIYLALLFFLFTFFFRIARTVSTLRGKQRISIIYIFLYLCTLEILPVLFIAKYVQYNFV